MDDWTWETLAGEELHATAAKLPAGTLEKWRLSADTISLQRHKPSFYTAGALLCVTPKMGMADAPVVPKGYFVLHADAALPLDFTGASIYRANDKAGLVLETDEQIRNYAIFFCSFLRSRDDQKFFWLVEDAHSSRFDQRRLTDEARKELAKILHPVQIARTSSGVITCSVFILNRGAVFGAFLTINKDGEVHMEADAPLMGDVPESECTLLPV